MKFLLTLFFAGIGALVIAQEEVEVTSSTTSDYDSLRAHYIKPYPDHFFFWPVLKQRSQDFELKSLSDPKDKLNYKSNKPYSLGLGMYLFDVSLELTFAVP